MFVGATEAAVLGLACRESCVGGRATQVGEIRTIGGLSYAATTLRRVATDPPDDRLDLLLALCLIPRGTIARAAAIDAGITLLNDLHAALLAEVTEGGEDLPEDSDARVNVAEIHITSIALSLVRGILALLPENVYAANALLRQLAEVEYLAWACANDRAEIVDWLTSDRQARLARWSPARLRERAGGRFDAGDYREHCEMGGHPTAAAGWVLFGPTAANPGLAAMPEVTMFEATLHFTAVTEYLAHGVPPSVEGRLGAIGRAHEQRAAWQSDDPACLWPRVRRGDPDALTMAASAL